MKKHSIILLSCSIVLMCGLLLATMLIERSERKKEASILATATVYTPAVSTDPTETTQPQSLMAPDFTVTGSDKKTYTNADFMGKPTIICFWTTEAESELTRMQELYDTHGKEANFVMIHMGTWGETKAAAQSFLKEKDYTFPVYFDITGSATATYQITTAPTTYFVTAEGALTARSKGEINLDVLPKALETIGLTAK